MQFVIFVISCKFSYFFQCRTGPKCHNPNFGLVTKAKGLQGCAPRGSAGVKVKRSQRCGPKRSPRVTSHTPGSVKQCEGI
jgi:hypothetical protein